MAVVFYPWAGGDSANVLEAAELGSQSNLSVGFQTSTVISSKLVNTLLKETSKGVYSLLNVLGDYSLDWSMDTADATLKSNVSAALTNAINAKVSGLLSLTENAANGDKISVTIGNYSNSVTVKNAAHAADADHATKADTADSAGEATTASLATVANKANAINTTSAIGSAIRPVYVTSSGAVTALTGTVGSSSRPVYMNNGSLYQIAQYGSSGGTNLDAYFNGVSAKTLSLSDGASIDGQTYSEYYITPIVRFPTSNSSYTENDVECNVPAVAFKHADLGISSSSSSSISNESCLFSFIYRWWTTSSTDFYMWEHMRVVTMRIIVSQSAYTDTVITYPTLKDTSQYQDAGFAASAASGGVYFASAPAVFVQATCKQSDGTTIDSAVYSQCVIKNSTTTGCTVRWASASSHSNLVYYLLAIGV